MCFQGQVKIFGSGVYNENAGREMVSYPFLIWKRHTKEFNEEIFGRLHAE